MSTLFPLLPFVADETPMSWAARQAAFHTGGRVIPFLNDLGIPVADLSRGLPEAVLRLCEKAGTDPNPVLHNSISAVWARRFKLRHLNFSSEFTTGPETRYCPACIQEDREGEGSPTMRMRHRMIWCLAPIRTCGVHKLALQSHRAGKWDDIVRDVADLPLSNAKWEEGALASVPSRDVSPLQLYVEARLEGASGPGWLDDQDIDQAVRSVEMLGGLALFGPSKKAAEMTQDMWDEAGRVAWPIVAAGECGIRDFLTQHTKQQSNSSSTAKLAGTYGMLYRWVGANRLAKDPGPIRKILREVITETTPLSIGQKVLGQRIVNPRLCTITSVAQFAGLHPQTMENILHVAGVLDQAAETTTLVNYREIASLVEAAKHAMPVTRVPDFLNVSRPMVASLVELGLLTRVQDHNVLKSKIGKSIDGRSIHALLEKIKSDFLEVDELPDTHVSLAKASEKTRVQITVILELLFAGHLKSALRFKEWNRLGAVLVNPDEVRKVLATPPPDCSDRVRFAM